MCAHLHDKEEVAMGSIHYVLSIQLHPNIRIYFEFDKMLYGMSCQGQIFFSVQIDACWMLPPSKKMEQTM